MSTNWPDELARQLILQSAPIRLPTPYSDSGTIAELFTPPSLAGPDGNFVEPDAALERSRRVVIVGPPGSGKTTLLGRLALLQATAFVNGHTPRCPAFVRAAELDPGHASSQDLASLVAPVLNRRYRILAALDCACKRALVEDRAEDSGGVSEKSQGRPARVCSDNQTNDANSCLFASRRSVGELGGSNIAVIVFTTLPSLCAPTS
jgi:hypothetical protein